MLGVPGRIRDDRERFELRERVTQEIPLKYQARSGRRTPRPLLDVGVEEQVPTVR